MSKVIVVTTTMKEVPENCISCPNANCTLPVYGKYQEKVKKAYLTKRHRDCPLRFVEEDLLTPVGKSRV